MRSRLYAFFYVGKLKMRSGRENLFHNEQARSFAVATQWGASVPSLRDGGRTHLLSLIDRNLETSDATFSPFGANKIEIRGKFSHLTWGITAEH